MSNDSVMGSAPEGARKEDAPQVGALKALELRLAAAVGPDTELDAEIWHATTGDEPCMVMPASLAVGEPLRQIGMTVHGRQCPRYTSSLDAALTLVPGGWTWDLHYGFAVDCELLFSKKGPLTLPEMVIFVHDASSMPLAVCRAAVRALQSGQE